MSNLLFSTPRSIRLLSLDFFTLVTLAILPSTPGGAAPVPPEAFSGIDLVSGQNQSIPLQNGQKATVVVFLSARCPCSGSHEPVLNLLAHQFAKKGFSFVGVHSNADEARPLSEKHFQASGLIFPVLQDDQAALANRLGAFKTPHVFVFAPDGRVLFQGGVDETHNGAVAQKPYLREALLAIDQGREPPHTETRAIGCVIKRP